MTHTPGPWTVHQLNHADGDLWLQIGFFRDGREVGPIAEMKYLITPEPECWANARLIAAAPLMEKALEAIRREPYGCPACDSGKLRYTEEKKGHWPGCGYRLAEEALQAVRGL